MDAQNQTAAVQQQLGEAQTTIQTLENEKAALTSQQEQAGIDLQQAKGQAAYLIFKTDLLRARLALKSSAGGPEAMDALKNAQTDLNILFPYVSKIDPNMGDVLQSRLDVVVAELIRDAKQAGSELDVLYERLVEMEEQFIPAE